MFELLAVRQEIEDKDFHYLPLTLLPDLIRDPRAPPSPR